MEIIKFVFIRESLIRNKMNKKNRIIVLVDFSEYSENLINFAASIAEIIMGEMILVHQVMGLTPAMANMEAKNRIIKTEMDEAYSNLHKLAGKFVYDIDAFHVSQNPVLTILKEIKSENYFDWVFTGIKETGVLKRIFLGSTTISIIDNPVIQIYEGKNFFELLKERVKHTTDSFLLLQQGSRSLMDYLFRKFMINELVYNTQTPLIVKSS